MNWWIRTWAMPHYLGLSRCHTKRRIGKQSATSASGIWLWPYCMICEACGLQIHSRCHIKIRFGLRCAHRIQVLKTPFKHTEIILHLSSFDLAVLVCVVHMVSTRLNNIDQCLQCVINIDQPWINFDQLWLTLINQKCLQCWTYSKMQNSVLKSCLKGSHHMNDEKEYDRFCVHLRGG